MLRVPDRGETRGEGDDMAATDADGDGLDDVISHWYGSVACFSGADFGLVWEHELDISLQVN